MFRPDELRAALMPALEKLYRQDPESIPFRQPVDPVLLQIPVSRIKEDRATEKNCKKNGKSSTVSEFFDIQRLVKLVPFLCALKFCMEKFKIIIAIHKGYITLSWKLWNHENTCLGFP